ncbi:glucosyltransferase [Podila verticillata]|nr:glucosyltransferase [Podila verticillata]
MLDLLSPSTLLSLHLVVLLSISSLWNQVQPHPYMDEIFHIPQAQRYCAGDYWTWDPKLTTPPGLYVISNLLLFLQRPVCSTYFLRLTNLIYPSIIFFTVASLLKQLHPHMTCRDRYATAAVAITFPILWFFNFMYYTDGGSTAFVLLSWLAAKRGYHFLSAVGSAVAVTFRQTNIIWSLFIVGTSLLDLSSPSERRSFDPKAAFIRSPLQIINAVFGFVKALLSKFPKAIAMALPYLGLLAGFVGFVRWNGGIVLGDRSNHVPVLHVVQLFYFVAFSAGMSLFAILGTVPMARLIRQPTLRSIPFVLASLGIMALCVQKFTYWTRYVLVPAYAAAAWSCWQALATEQTILWVIIYATATALTLIPSPLLEFRYFITPYLIYRISMRQPRGVWLVLELLGYCTINIVTMWLLMTKPFRWPHEDGVQRFMW